jgi:hypothetical protein
MGGPIVTPIALRYATPAYKRGYRLGAAGLPQDNAYPPDSSQHTQCHLGYVKGLNSRARVQGANSRSAVNDELRDRYGTVFYRTATRCPGCGAKSHRRRPLTNLCLECCIIEMRGAK